MGGSTLGKRSGYVKGPKISARPQVSTSRDSLQRIIELEDRVEHINAQLESHFAQLQTQRQIIQQLQEQNAQFMEFMRRFSLAEAGPSSCSSQCPHSSSS